MDPKGMAALAKKAGGAPPEQHQEPDGDEQDGAPHSDDDGDEGEGAGEGGGDFNGHTDKEVADFLADAIQQGYVSPAVRAAAGDGSEMPEGADEELWNRAVNAVQPKGTGAEEYDDPGLLVVACYQMFGGELPKAGGEEGEPADDGDDDSGDEPGAEDDEGGDS